MDVCFAQLMVTGHKTNCRKKTQMDNTHGYITTHIALASKRHDLPISYEYYREPLIMWFEGADLGTIRDRDCIRRYHSTWPGANPQTRVRTYRHNHAIQTCSKLAIPIMIYILLC